MNWKKVSWIVTALVAVVAGAAVFVCYRYPLAVFAWYERSTLKSKGFTKSTIAAPNGPMVVWESGQGPTLVLLHGAGDQAGAWCRVAPDLASTYHLLIPDFPGHGESAPAAGPLTLGMEIDGLEALLTARAGGQPVILVGNSMGGWISMVYAYRHPDRVSRIVLLNGAAIRPEHQPNLTPSTREEARQVLASAQDKGTPLPPDFVIDDIIRTSHSGPIGRLSANIGDMEQYLLEGHLQDAKTPTDVIWGEEDRMLGINYARRLETELPAVRLTLLKRCGHVVTRECPVALTTELQRVLKESPPSVRTVAGTQGKN